MHEYGKSGDQSLRSLRNIGPALEDKLRIIGINSIEDFNRSQPEDLYLSLRAALRYNVDRCVLYSFEGARRDLPWAQCKKFFEIDNCGNIRRSADV